MLKQKTVYFREEDLPLWESIPNKAEWLHEKLAGVSASGSNIGLARAEQQPATLQEQALGALEGECLGHTLRMNCGLKGCKYA